MTIPRRVIFVVLELAAIAACIAALWLVGVIAGA